MSVCSWDKNMRNDKEYLISELTVSGHSYKPRIKRGIRYLLRK